MLLLLLVISFAFSKTFNERFMDFILKFEKSYESFEELAHRRTIFINNLKRIEELKQSKSYEVDVNHFTDMTSEEFLEHVTSEIPSSDRKKSYVDFDTGVSAPESFDWRKNGAVTKVKNQGQCGSCWAFSTAAAIEGALALHNGTLVDLSPQDLMECSSRYGNHGCNGGLMDFAFKFVKDKGILTWEQRPYKMSVSIFAWLQCRKRKPTVFIDGFTDVKPEEDAVVAALTKRPLSVGVYVCADFQFYSGGVFKGCDDPNAQMNHGVTLVGYDPESFLVKNSWGDSWGEKGYIRLARGANTAKINEAVSYPYINDDDIIYN